MIILDTNVVSALMLRAPDQVVSRWLDRHSREAIWVTVFTVFELRYGIERLPESRRRRQLERAFERVFAVGFQQRILAMDDASAAASAVIAAKRKSAGRPVDLRDTFIGGIAVARQADLATRNVRHFQDLDIRVINPWTN